MDGEVGIADIDGDGDEDILQIGLHCNPAAQLCINEGDLNFKIITDTDFIPVHNEAFKFADIDNDGDQDILIMGFERTFENPGTRLYENDGSGNFTELTHSKFVGLANGSIDFEDIDNDGDQDVLITGSAIPNGSEREPKAIIYENNGEGIFTEINNSILPGIWSSKTAFVDVNGDEKKELFMFGWSDNNPENISRVFRNDGDGEFYVMTDQLIEATQIISASFSDIDLDGDIDLLVMGIDFNERFATFLINDGFGNFTEKPAPDSF